MDADTEAERTVLELESGLDDTDADVRALTQALLNALRARMHDGRTVVITRDDQTREVRVESYDPTRPDPATSLDDASSDRLDPFEPEADEGGPCPGPGRSTSRHRRTLRSDRRRR